MNQKLYMIWLISLMNSSLFFGSNEEKVTQDMILHLKQKLDNRYIINYRSAVKDYNKLIHAELSGGCYGSRLLTSSEKKALMDAKIAEQKVLYPWGFQWLATIIVKNHLGLFCKMPKWYSNSQIEAILPNPYHSETMARVFNNSSYHMAKLKKYEVSSIRGAVIINRNNLQRQDVTKQLSYQDWLREVEQSEKQALTGVEEVQLLQYAYSTYGGRDLLDWDYVTDSKPRWKKYYENLLVGMGKETRDEQIARLKKENPVDLDVKTNQIANLFNRISIEK
ncbi:hypothetical protein KBC04_03300 [Candidatus Babeliales bacterium]|nr:hypothetical protein [Candidatus Babeliales bacterium]MBP9843922.1 hypothetical protein [Candidatus Babeliales bacterium]